MLIIIDTHRKMDDKETDMPYCDMYAIYQSVNMTVSSLSSDNLQ